MRVFFVFVFWVILGFLPLRGQELFVGFIATESWDTYDEYNLHTKGINLEYSQKLPAFNLTIGYVGIHEGAYKLGFSNNVSEHIELGLNMLYFDKGFMKAFPVKFGAEFSTKFSIPISDSFKVGANSSIGFSTYQVFYTIGLHVKYNIFG